MVLKGVRHVLGRHLARRRGGPGLKNTLIQCTWAAARKTAAISKRSSSACAPDPPRKRTIGALAASILTAAYHMLEHGTLYHDLDPNTSTAGPRPFRPGV
jgi:transposase